MKASPKGFASILFLMVVSALNGCSMFSSTPERVIHDYGNSVQGMVNQSIYNKDKAVHPAPIAPDGIEGQKAAVLYQRTYQSDVGIPSRVKAPAQLGISNSGNAGSGN